MQNVNILVCIFSEINFYAGPGRFEILNQTISYISGVYFFLYVYMYVAIKLYKIIVMYA